MLDNLKIQIPLDVPKMALNRINAPLRLLGQTFDPVIRNGVVIRYKSSIGNLHLSFREDVLTIQNSIHKYILGDDNNYSSMTNTQLFQGVIQLGNELGLDLLIAKIISFELGVVITDNNIPETLSKLGHYKGNRPMPMQVNGKVYGTFYENSTHKLKFYDKSFEVKKRSGKTIESNLLRIEKKYSRSQLQNLAILKNNRIHTLGDLLSWVSLELLAKDLVDSISKIELKSIPPEIRGMSPKNLKSWCYLQDPYFRNYMKKYHLKAFEKDRAAANKIINQYRSDGYDRLIEAVRYKLDYCLNN